MPTHTFQIHAFGCRQHEPSDSSSLDAVTRQLPPGLYTTFRTYERRTRVLGLRAHLTRLYAPAAGLGLQPDVPAGQVRHVLSILLEEYAREFPAEARVRLMLDGQGRVFAMLEPLTPLPPEVYRDGVRLVTLEMQRRTPRLKSTAFIEDSQSQRRWLAGQGAFEALMVRRGLILEGLTRNFFYVHEGQLGTAARGVLLGVTRRAALHVARRLGLEVVYHPLRLAQVPAIAEAFICSSSRGLVPAVEIDGLRVGPGRPGAVTGQLARAYEAYVLQRAEPIV
jgi:branched-subunit amino acid aminotransferase/4-amino-4-deoxychorismate lyase